jgi:outer membrane receptor protein involved in Fe transport
VFSQQDSGKLFKLNLAYDLAPRQMAYATVSQGYRRGGANAVPLVGNFKESAAYLTYAPDTNINYEVGLKGAVGTTKYGVSAFYIDWKDVQVETSTPNWGFFAAQNGGRASSKGLEFELSGALGADWRYGLNYAFVDAKLEDDVLRVDKPSVVVAPAGTRLPGTARHTVSGSIEHAFSLANGWYWQNRLSAYYQGPTENAISTNAKYKHTWGGFSQLGFTSSISGDNWSASLFVKNLLNNAGVTGGFLEQHMGTDPSQNYYGNGSKVFISQPRTIGVSMAYNF